MSINVHEAIKAIRDMAPIIDPEEDYLTIVAAEESIATKEAKRKKEIDEAHTKLKALSKILEAARISSTRPASVPSAEVHAATLNDLDTNRLSLAKSISDVENLLTSKKTELAALKEEARRLEDYDPAAEHEKELDGTALRLEILKGLGFEPISDKNGNVTKIIVHAESGDVHIMDFPTKSHVDFTQKLWTLASS
ncbi:hypothetical protein BD779DRAFT_1195646 [Infundibulicybe gibba]|nr:hypothetical protein BD779DRAFT_1195646 [Infundibulicybe gibba]